MKMIFSILIFLIFAPNQDSEKIVWNENRKLTWDDFRATPIQNANFVANTNSAIHFSYSYTIENNNVQVRSTVESFFSPKRSWYIPGKVTTHILAHEQTHFDISELHARILRKKIEQKRFTKNVKSEIEAIYRQVDEQKIAMQKKFDAESDHSRNVKNEMRWRQYIATQLAEHNQWR